MGKRRKARSVRARSGRSGSSTSWQLWTVAAGIAVVLAALGTALVRGTGPYRSEYQGTVISKRITQQPGELDPLARRQLTLEQEDGSLLRVEVEERLYAVVEEGYFVHRSQQDGIEIRDPKGRLVALQKKARGNDGK